MNSFAVEAKYNEGVKKIANKLFDNLQREPNNVHEHTERFQLEFIKLQYARDWANEIASEELSLEAMLEPITFDPNA